jgi:hypothetical protein
MAPRCHSCNAYCPSIQIASIETPTIRIIFGWQLQAESLAFAFVLMRGFRLGAAARRGQLAADTSSILSIVCMFPTGMIFGLLTLYLLRGTRGTLLAPISDVVQVEDPYGVAFACTIAALFSDRIILWLTKLVSFLPNEGSNGREGSGH